MDPRLTLDQNDQPLEELLRANNMLIAEGLFNGPTSTHHNADANPSLDNLEYQTKLKQIRELYQYETNKYENHCRDFCSHVKSLLREQSHIRPMSDDEIERLISIIQKKFAPVQLQLKQSTCEALMILRSRFLDARSVSFILSRMCLHLNDVSDESDEILVN